MKRFILFAFAILISANIQCIFSQVVYSVPKKKLIEFGLRPSPREFKEKMAFFENGPFDGISMNLPAEAGRGNIFMIADWKKASRETQKKELNAISSLPQSKVLTDNFLVLYGASQMNWFSDKDWAMVNEQVRFIAKMAKAGGCKGIVWDPEPYKPGKNPWKFNEQEGYKDIPFQKYYDQVRKRGAQFIKALQEEFPGLVVFSLRAMSDFQDGSPFSQHVLPISDPKSALDKLEKAWWGLNIPFIIGIMDEIKPDVIFIDGNEDSYFYTSALEYYRISNIIKSDGRALVPKQLYTKFAHQYQMGNSISPDFVSGNWARLGSFPKRISAQALMLTPEERALWFEHNTYYALRTAEEYVWLYTARMNWWTGERVPTGFQDALISARKKVANLEPLGFKVENMLIEAQDKAEKEYKDQK